MLTITVPYREQFNSETQEFIYTKETKLVLEHSLLSIAKWEAKWHKVFLGKNKKTPEETLDYIRCMTITQNVDPNVYYALTEENLTEIDDYINDPMSALIFKDEKNKQSKEPITNELIYYWMTTLNIPVEFEKWHVNRLLSLIKLAGIKNQPKKKTSQKELIDRYHEINEANKKKFNTRG